MTGSELRLAGWAMNGAAPSETLLMRYAGLTAARPDFDGLTEQLSVFVPRFDAYITYRAREEGSDLPGLIHDCFSGELRDYFLEAWRLGYIGRGGATVAPNEFMLNFAASAKTLLWIPKNSCTSLKEAFIAAEGNGRGKKIRINGIHEAAQAEFGVHAAKLAGGLTYPPVAVVRNPLGRLASCYLDKFVKPLKRNKRTPEYIRRIFDQISDEPGNMTFRTFAAFVLLQPVFSLNVHWRPQEQFFGGIAQKVQIFAVEHFEEMLAYCGLSAAAERRNVSYGKSFTAAAISNAKALADLPARALASMNIEDYAQLYDSEIAELTSEFYVGDLAMHHQALAQPVTRQPPAGL